MAHPKFFVVDSFTDQPLTGNPAGVVITQSPFPPDQMQKIAGELHLETAFLTPLTGQGFQVAYYTGSRRIPLCGHDTVAAATVLHRLGVLSAPGETVFHTDIGALPIQIDEAGTVTLGLAAPTFEIPITADTVTGALGVLEIEIATRAAPIQTVSAGTPFLFVPLLTRKTLDTLQPDMARLAEFLAGQPGEPAGLYAWTRETESMAAFVRGRCFAPGAGLPEDPVTGSASGALGALLARHRLLPLDADGVGAFLTEQGNAMGRPGGARVRVRVSGDEVAEITVSGRAVIIGSGELYL